MGYCLERCTGLFDYPCFRGTLLPMDLNLIASSAGPPIVFMLAMWFLTLAFRRVIEKTWPYVAPKTYWKDVVLPVMPPALGAACAVAMHKFPFLDTLPSWGTRAFYGLVAGGCSGFLYRILKAVVKKTYGVNLSGHPGALEQPAAVVIPENPVPVVEEAEEPTNPNNVVPSDKKE